MFPEPVPEAETEAYNEAMDAPTDEQLLRQYLAGDRAGFELLVRRHSRELHQFVYRFTGNAAAEDVMQETFLQVHHSAASFDQKRRFKPWLFTIAANKARDHLRRLNRRREVSFEAEISHDGGSGKRFLDLLPGQYNLVFESPGFRRVENPRVQVNQSTITRIDITLPEQPGISEAPRGLTTIGDTPISFEFRVDLVREEIDIANVGIEAVNLQGWVLTSLRGNERFTFPDLTLTPGQLVTVTSGPNASDEPPRYLLWTIRHVWNNAGDLAELRDASGEVVAISGGGPSD